jgi:hypothetical protein
MLIGQFIEPALKLALEFVEGGPHQQAVQEVGNSAYIAINAPLVVVQDGDKFFGAAGNVVERFKGDAVGESRIAPKIATTFSLEPRLSRATAMPSAAERAVPHGRHRSNHARFLNGEQSR